MVRLPIFQVDAFTTVRFRGNPAAVVPLTRWLDDESLQAIASENNLSETAFFVPESKGEGEGEGEGFALRWFTPAAEVRLCGHATLATAAVLYDKLGYTRDSIRFSTLSGELLVRRAGEKLELDFPSQAPAPITLPEGLVRGARAEAALAREDAILIFASEAEVRALRPNSSAIAALPQRGLIVSAPGNAVDFVARFFAPALGIEEDPVTGSAFTQLAPYWAERLGKQALSARQLSARGGEIDCELRGERVLLRGGAVHYLSGEIEV